MASDKTNYVLVLYMFFLLLQLHFGLMSAYQAQKIRPPAPVRASISPVNPPVMIGYRVNRFKKIEKDAFRPTAPGNSPGMGHDDPPGRANHKH
ncbi:UNVERIFIED_CONTAM: Precursor of CEP4 [Sesamum latifolium]|uniref:Precursor of CEP4 n=1 Tax=Sesamum latifolium TaxID=2727402 RepID=A0AAW2X110_9LAMI